MKNSVQLGSVRTRAILTPKAKKLISFAILVSICLMAILN